MSASANDSGEEKVFYSGRLPLRVFMAQHNVLYLLLLGWNIGLLFDWIRLLSWSVRITDQRVVVTRGIIARSEEDLPLFRVEDCSYQQSIMERIFGTGWILIISSDQTSPELWLPMVNPSNWKEQIRKCAMLQRKQNKVVNIDSDR